MPIEIASPVSRLRSNIAERAPLCVARGGIAVSLYSLIALSRSVFLNFDLMTPACICHLREKIQQRLRCLISMAVLARDRCGSACRPNNPANAGYDPILLLPLGGESRHGSSVGNKFSPGHLRALSAPLPPPLPHTGRAGRIPTLYAA